MSFVSDMQDQLRAIQRCKRKATLSVHCNNCGKGCWITMGYDHLLVYWCTYCGHRLSNRELTSIEALYELHKEHEP